MGLGRLGRPGAAWTLFSVIPGTVAVFLAWEPLAHREPGIALGMVGQVTILTASELMADVAIC